MPNCSAAIVASCADWQECVPNLDGGACEGAGLALSWVSPAAGAILDGGSAVAASVSIQKKDGGVVLPTGVPVSGPAGLVTFAKVGMVASGNLTLPGADGPKTFVAGWADAGMAATLTLNKDATAPALTVTVLIRPDAGDPDPLDPTAWKKDEKALVRVEVMNDPAVSASPANFSVPWSGAVTPSAAVCGCATAECRCFEVDLAATTVNGIRATQGFTVGPVKDAAGNASNVASGMVKVTRFKWQRQIGSSTTATPLPVAVSQSGTVLAGTVEAGPYRLVALSQRAVHQWSAVDAGTVTSGPVVGPTEMWVGSLGAFAQLQSVALSDGTLGTPECIQANSASYEGDLGLARVTVGTAADDRPVGLRGGQLRVGDGSCGFLALTGFTSPAHLVMLDGGSGLEVFVAGGAATLWKARLDSVQTWTSQGSTTFSIAPAKGLFLDGTYFGGGGVANGGVFSTSASGPLSVTTTFASYAPTGAAQAGPVSVGSSYVLYGDSSGRLVKVSYVGGMFGTTESAATVAPGSSTQETNPIIGANGHVYSVAANGSLIVSAAPTLAEEWRADSYFPISGSKLAQPALDVLRAGSGARDCRGLGVLYVSTANVGVASLTALLVDSPGLEPTAPWPKFQRDNANAGNISRPLAPWVCP